jgi:hypothetical protein
MHKLAKNKIIVDKGVDTVFNYAANLENFALWFPGVVSIASANDLKFMEKGKKYRETFTSLGSKKKVIIEVKECLPMQQLITESEFLPILPRMEITFQKLDGNRTEVSWSMFSRNNSFLWLIFQPLAKLIMHNRSKKGLRRLKEIMADA